MLSLYLGLVLFFPLITPFKLLLHATLHHPSPPFLLISSNPTLHKANTRNCNANNNNKVGDDNNPGNPAPPPTIEQVLDHQTQLLQTMQPNISPCNKVTSRHRNINKGTSLETSIGSSHPHSLIRWSPQMSRIGLSP
jgi:hypothetical protein